MHYHQALITDQCGHLFLNILSQRNLCRIRGVDRARDHPDVLARSRAIVPFYCRKLRCSCELT